MSEENADKCTECGQCVAFCPEGAAEQEISEGKTLGPSLAYDIKNLAFLPDGAQLATSRISSIKAGETGLLANVR